MKTVITFASAGLMVASSLFFSLTQVAQCRKETRALEASLAAALNRPPPPPPAPPEPPPIEVADIMTKLQRHANKLYFAGKTKNWKLVDFYVEEIEETAKDFSKKDIMRGQINISGLMGALVVTQIEELEKAVSTQNAAEFEKQYHTLISNCNECHKAVKLPFIVIREPQKPAYDNQQYEPVDDPRLSSATEPIKPGIAELAAHSQKSPR